MAKRNEQSNFQPSKNAAANAVSSAFPPQHQIQIQQVQEVQHAYQGPVPPPDILRAFDALVPGTAKRLIDLAESESQHRRDMEQKVLAANIAAQSQQLDLADEQSRIVYRTDTTGQSFGFAVALACIAGSVYLSVNGHEVVATALAAIPTAAVIKAFFSPKPPN